MSQRVIEIVDLVRARAELLAIGADPSGVELMAPKAVSRALKLKSLKPPAANIIKQEMLSIGGEAATAHGSIDHSVDTTDLLILGTLKQFGQLAAKLKTHQFSLPQIGEQIASALKNYDSTPAPLRFTDTSWVFGPRTYVMGVLNVTPDSFSDGGKFINTKAAVAQAKQMLADGADIIDIGGESTRPGSDPVTADEEIERVVPVIEQLIKGTKALISIDTTKAQVAETAIKAGAAMINDISGLRSDQNMARVAAQANVPVCLMHIKGQPKNMQQNPEYSDVMEEVVNYLLEGLEIAQKAGILLEKLIVDPGIGFGKTVEHNLEILKRLRELKALGRPVLVGTSRKSFIGQVLDLPVDQRLEGTAATVALSIVNGADIIRVHDVRAMSRVAKMTDPIVRRK